MKKTNRFDREVVERAVRLLLVGIGEDPDREGLKGTPRRVAGYYKELLAGNNLSNEEIADKFKKDFNVSHDPMVMVTVEDVFSHCEHHLALMYDGDVTVGYIPRPSDTHEGMYKVLGLSKIPRIVDMCSKRLQLQEKLASDIAECISLVTGSDMVYVNLNMKHGCVSARGARAKSTTNVTFMTPKLRADHDAKDEFERKANELMARRGK